MVMVKLHHLRAIASNHAKRVCTTGDTFGKDLPYLLYMIHCPSILTNCPSNLIYTNKNKYGYDNLTRWPKTRYNNEFLQLKNRSKFRENLKF